MKIYLRDRNPEMAAAWEKYFSKEEDVFVSCGDIFDDGPHMEVDAIVSPANSFGFMDGGIDYVYSEFFGWDVSEKLRKQIQTFHSGELLVGNVEIVRMDGLIPFLISAPTMRVPQDVSETVNAYLAFKAVLKYVGVRQYSSPDFVNAPAAYKSILCPGLGTAIGKMPYDRCAFQMHEAYKEYKNYQHVRVYDILGDAYKHHILMSKLPPNFADATLNLY